MKIELLFLTIIVIVTLSISCIQRDRIKPVFINELGKDTIINIKTSATSQTTLKIAIKGTANDSFIISGFKIKGGEVDTFWHTDWYKKTITINYQAYKATKGKLTMKCLLY